MTNRPLHMPIGLTDSQLSQVTAAAGLSRIESRTRFLQDVAAQLTRLRPHANQQRRERCNPNLPGRRTDYGHQE
jgi:hypothetical protein